MGIDMRKLAVAALILGLIAAGWVTEGYALGHMSREMVEHLDKVTIDLEAENFESAAVHMDEFIDSWQKCEGWVTMLVPHEEVDEISRNAAKMKTFAASGGKDDALYTVSDTKELLKEIHRKTHVNLMNIF